MNKYERSLEILRDFNYDFSEKEFLAAKFLETRYNKKDEIYVNMERILIKTNSDHIYFKTRAIMKQKLSVKQLQYCKQVIRKNMEYYACINYKEGVLKTLELEKKCQSKLEMIL